MGLIDKMPSLLEQRQEVPKWLEVGYAMWTVRAMLGGNNGYREYADLYRDSDGRSHVIRWTHRHYESVEEEALANIILENMSPEQIEMYEHHAEDENDQPRIRAHFLQNVDRVAALLNTDGTYRIHNKRGDLQWTGSPYKIALELNTLPSVVRAAQARLKTV